MKNHVSEKNAFESLETPEMTRTQCRMLHLGIQGEILLFLIKDTVFPFHTSYFRRVYRTRPAEEGL